MGDVVERLRTAGADLAVTFGEDSGTELLAEAADRIEELEHAHDLDQRSVHTLGEQVAGLIVDNDALRADLAELVAALPKCLLCNAPSTHVHSGPEGLRSYRCCEHRPPFLDELDEFVPAEWAPIIHRLAREKEGKT